jgi:hypothetical protein
LLLISQDGVAKQTTVNALKQAIGGGGADDLTLTSLNPASVVGPNDLLLISQSGEAKRAAVSLLQETILGDKTNLAAASASDTLIIRSDGAIYDVTVGALIPALNITTGKIANDAVTGEKLQSSLNTDASRAVTTNHIRDAAITSPKLGPASVKENAIDTNAVTTTKIKDGAVTGAKISPEAMSLTEFGPFVYNDEYTASWRRLLNFDGAADTVGSRVSEQGNVSASGRMNLFSMHEERVASLNFTTAEFALSVKKCSPVFPGWNQASTVSGHTTLSRGGAYSGGVLLPDGRVFLVPYNAPPAIYDPSTDTHEILAWPNGTPPNGSNPNYALYCGGALVPYGAGSVGSPPGRVPSNDFSSSLSADLAVVCAPFYAKKPLLYSLTTGMCRYGDTVSDLPNRAFGGVSVVPSSRQVNSRRCAVLSPHASGSLYLVSNTGEMSIVPGGPVAPATYGAQMHPNTGEIGFGGFRYAPTNNTWIAGSIGGATQLQNFPCYDGTFAGSVLSVSQDGNFYKNDALLTGGQGHPAEATTNGYKASGIVYTEDYYVMIIPGFWGSGVKPKVLMRNVNASDHFTIQADVGTNITDTSTAAPGNGLFAGGVRLLDGRVFLVPCTSEKAYIISTRTGRTAGPSYFHLGPIYNKR